MSEHFGFTRGKRQIQCVRLYLSVNLVKTAVLITQKVFPFSMPVKWQAPSDVKGLSPVLIDWLLNTGSLTERLQALTTRFQVDLLGQEVAGMDETERKNLAQSNNKKWQIREVILQGLPLVSNSATSPHSDIQDWVFARSVLPNELCHSKWANLGNQPLGSRIFNDDNFVRSEFEIGKLAYHPLTHEAFGPQQICWARRSKFTIENYELLVAEAFLPHSPCYW
ncbi:MAG: chorismate--pyruvate lyase [Alphaproteobacteria bacterium]|jgi:chorismate--pyruvate lyase